MAFANNSPSICIIQEAMGLVDDSARFTTIRKTAATLLKTAGISLRPETDSLVQRKKREIANELEQLFPLEFGATPGIDRDYAEQKGTSYALLTLAMDAAKRQSKLTVKVLSPAERQIGRKRRFAERASPPLPRPTRGSVEEQPLASASAPEPHRAPPTRQEPISIPPKPVSTSIVVLKVPPNRPAPVAAVDILLIIRGDCSGLDVYSPMTRSEMTGPGCDRPSLVTVHENLREDGLDLPRDDYTLVNAEGQPVRSDRCLNFVLDEYRTLGTVKSEWRFVQNCNLVFPVLI